MAFVLTNNHCLAHRKKIQQEAFCYLAKAHLIKISPEDVPEYKKPLHSVSIVLAETCLEEQTLGMKFFQVYVPSVLPWLCSH